MFTNYEEEVLQEIARHIIEPNPVERLLALAGKPIGLLMEGASKVKMLSKVTDAVNLAVQKSVTQTVIMANGLCSEKGIIEEFEKEFGIRNYQSVLNASLEKKDFIADKFSLSNAAFVGIEGVLMGLAASLCEGVPGAQILIPTVITTDVGGSLTLLSRHICQIATSYGYSSQKPENIPHVLASMVPQTTTSDEGFFSTKAVVLKSIREASKFMAENTAKQIKRMIADSEAPSLIKLINYVAERLGVVITEKELGILVPIAGAVLNGSVNVAFQQSGHIAAKDYFRRLHLEAKYGEKEVNKAIKQYIDEIKIKSTKKVG
jgi:hypothetical protein